MLQALVRRATMNEDSTEVDVDDKDVPSACEKIWLFDLIKHPNMQLASKYHEDVLGFFVLIYLLVNVQILFNSMTWLEPHLY